MSQLFSILRMALTITHKWNPIHFASLMGERMFGSKWGKSISHGHLKAMFRTAVELENSGNHKRMLPFCRYFKVDLTDICPDAHQEISLVKDLPETIEVKVKEGPHGKQLSLVSLSKEERRVSYGHIIVGPGESCCGATLNDMMIWTAYPGDLTEKIPTEYMKCKNDGDRILVADLMKAGGANWTVKLV